MVRRFICLDALFITPSIQLEKPSDLRSDGKIKRNLSEREVKHDESFRIPELARGDYAWCSVRAKVSEYLKLPILLYLSTA